MKIRTITPMIRNFGIKLNPFRRNKGPTSHNISLTEDIETTNVLNKDC